MDDPRIFDDPLALRIIGAEAEKALRSNPEYFQTDLLRHLRALIAMRSRYAEDGLAEAVSGGVRQYVILGAGLDTFAYRNPYTENLLHVFEVDHPATQEWKREQLKNQGISIPASLTFAPFDFEKETLAQGLIRAGFRVGEPAFFSWLGVAIYLTETAVMETLAFAASSPAGSGIVFEFSVPLSYLNETQRARRKELADRLAAIGEPFLTFFDPSSLERDLRRMGFGHVEHFAPKEANLRYFKDRADGLSVGGSGHLMKARV